MHRFGPRLSISIITLLLVTGCTSRFTLSSLFNPSAQSSSAPSSSNNPSLQTLPNPLPSNTTFTPPAPNACNSNYDQFYGKEPGVYAYWGLCESGSSPLIYDYVGKYDFNPAGTEQSWSSGAGSYIGGQPGPVPDGETAMKISTASSYVADLGMFLNSNQGTLSAWLNVDAQTQTLRPVSFDASTGSSTISLGTSADANATVCFSGTYGNSSGTTTSIPKQCGFAANSWHRLTLTWASGALTLYVDGKSAGTAQYSGRLDSSTFLYRLFPQCCDTGKQMTLAKVVLSNQAWSSAQAANDFSGAFIVPPTGGVYVSGQQLGTIHRDVLGYNEGNANLSTSTTVDPLVAGLRASGMGSVRYADGVGIGIGSDLSDWQGGPSCTSKQGVTQVSPMSATSATQNSLDNYMAKIVQPAGLHMGYNVNYGSNPPACNAGGDPVVNGANLVNYANNTKHYGIKYWEIGNELYSSTSETDFHPNAYSGATYATYESAFYTAMKAQDDSIQIAIPMAEDVFSWLQNWTMPALAGASYDAVVFHDYPIVDPISDGDTLYPDRVASNLYRTRGALLATQTALLNNGKDPSAIWATEWGIVVGTGTAEWSRQSLGAVAPIFAATTLAEFMRAGVPYASWLAQGQNAFCNIWNYDAAGEGAYNWYDGCGGGFLFYIGPTNVPAGEKIIGMKPADLTPETRGFQILSQSGFVTEGEHMLETYTDNQNAPWLLTYAATHGSSYAVILINRDRDITHTVPVQLGAQSSGGQVSQWTYGRAQYDQSYFGNWSLAPFTYTQGSWKGTFQATLAPWSINVFVFSN